MICLKQATEYVFTDMQSSDRHAHAHACYTTSHKRASALLQWFDTVSISILSLYYYNGLIQLVF